MESGSDLARLVGHLSQGGLSGPIEISQSALVPREHVLRVVYGHSARTRHHIVASRSARANFRGAKGDLGPT
jgi:hypothetical protein